MPNGAVAGMFAGKTNYFIDMITGAVFGFVGAFLQWIGVLGGFIGEVAGMLMNNETIFKYSRDLFIGSLAGGLAGLGSSAEEESWLSLFDARLDIVNRFNKGISALGIKIPEAVGEFE